MTQQNERRSYYLDGEPYPTGDEARDTIIRFARDHAAYCLLGTTSPEQFDSLDSATRGRIRHGLRLVAEWATDEHPAVALDCILGSVMADYARIHSEREGGNGG